LAEEAQEDTEWNYEAKEAVVIKDADFTWERHPTREDEDDPPGKKGSPGTRAKGKKDKRKSVQSVVSNGSGSASGSVRNEEARSGHVIKLSKIERCIFCAGTTQNTDSLSRRYGQPLSSYTSLCLLALTSDLGRKDRR
jgi:hypothetical protein